MIFWVGMYVNMIFIKMGNDCFWQWVGVFCFVDEFWVNWFFIYQNSDVGILWFVILVGDVKNISFDNGTGF